MNHTECKSVCTKQPIYITAKELSDRWQCARSSVDRVARRAGVKRLYLGEGRNGMVRFLRKDIENYERERLI